MVPIYCGRHQARERNLVEAKKDARDTADRQQGVSADRDEYDLSDYKQALIGAKLLR